MPESQGVNGDMWNSQAVKLMELFGWGHIGDTNMDLPGSDGKEYGVDALMLYKSPMMEISQSCVIESKRYSTKSLQKGKVRSWIETLRKKIEIFSNSSELLKEFPALEEGCQVNMGLIMCWVHDAPSESYFSFDFEGMLRDAIISTQSNNVHKRIIVFTNPRILRLCSIAEVIGKNRSKYRFIYPCQLLGGKPKVRSQILSIEYACSDFILAERESKEGDVKLVVFYIGKITPNTFKCLKQALLIYNLIERNQEIKVYYYGTEIEFRSILADGRRIFKDEDVDVKFIPLAISNLNTEPAILSINEDEDE